MFTDRFIVQRAAGNVNLSAIQNHELIQVLSASEGRIERGCDAFHIGPCWPRLDLSGQRQEIIATGSQRRRFKQMIRILE